MRFHAVILRKEGSVRGGRKGTMRKGESVGEILFLFTDKAEIFLEILRNKRVTFFFIINIDFYSLQIALFLCRCMKTLSTLIGYFKFMLSDWF